MNLKKKKRRRNQGRHYILRMYPGLNEFEQEADKSIHRYHSWEHYSSVRNIDGPYSGPPEIKVQIQPGY